jgi:hypothetical protein
MIKLTVDPQVLISLQQTFPTPVNSAARALNKYLAAIEGLIFNAIQRGITPEQRKLKLFAISLHELANRGGRIGPDKIRLHKWLKENKLEIVQKVENGDKFRGEYSLVKLSKLANISGQLTVSAKQIDEIKSDRELNRYLTGDESDNAAVFKHLYPELDTTHSQESVLDQFDFAPIDVESLKAFIVWLSDRADVAAGDKLAQSLIHAKTILAVAAVTDGIYPQRRKTSPFGRIYYEGVSVQNVHKELRRAMLGDCWEYDIRSSVVSWKMGFARRLLKDAGLALDVRSQFPATSLYLEDKTDFMSTVRYFTFEGNVSLTPEFQLGLIKQALTAISFGAKILAKGWTDCTGNWHNTALVEILQNSLERNRFLSDPTVKAFIAEQKALDQYVFDLVKLEAPQLLDLEILKSQSGRISKSKTISYLYQHAETQAIDYVLDYAEQHGHKPIARVHDAIFFRNRLGVDLKSEIEYCLHQHTANSFWHLTPKQIKRYAPISIDQKLEEQLHKQRIVEESLLAASYFH